MGKYMITGSYTAEGARGLLADGGTARREAIEEAMSSVGGSVDAFYFMFGGDDVVVICDAPDDETIASTAITAAASGMVNTRTTVLLTPEQIDAASKKSPAYRPPGG